uniref:Uncharacterized protein n=1 Tax=Amphimedon queenslandica TaxID=400682 RepID=A0A1X7UXF3_AMPQE
CIDDSYAHCFQNMLSINSTSGRFDSL